MEDIDGARANEDVALEQITDEQMPEAGGSSDADDAEREQQAQQAKSPEELERRLQQTEQQLEYFRELLRQNQELISLYKDKSEPKEKDPFEGLDPDEPLTVKQIQMLEEKILQKSQKALQDVESRYKRSLVAISEKAAKLRYDDYDDVLQYAVEMAKEDPLILQKIAQSDDPAEEAYRWGQRHPKYIEKVRSKAKGDVTDKIKSNLNKATSSTPNRAGSVPKKDIFEMTPEEFAEYRRRKLGE